MDEVHVLPNHSKWWWDDGQWPRFSRPMDEAGRASEGLWTRSHITRTDLRGGGTMDDVRIFLTRWTMLSVRPWDDGRYSTLPESI